jgi:hypothetical protein
MRVEESVEINRPVEEVFSYVRSRGARSPRRLSEQVAVIRWLSTVAKRKEETLMEGIRATTRSAEQSLGEAGSLGEKQSMPLTKGGTS